MEQEKVYLSWDTYTDHLKEMLHDMMSYNELTDITLVSEDRKQFKAHKIILSASSPVFKSIIGHCLMSSPFIYLKGILSQEIETILRFIYLGETTFNQDRLNMLLDVAKSLEIKEIYNTEQPNLLDVSEDFEIDDFEQESSFNKSGHMIEPIDSKQSLKEKEFDIKPFNKMEQPNLQDESEDFEIDNFEQESTSNKSNHMIEPIDIKLSLKEKKLDIKPFNKRDSISFCDQCGIKVSSKESLLRHKNTIHGGNKKFKCTQCPFKCTRVDNLAIHIQSIHEGVKYPCGQCNYKATQSGHLSQHIKKYHNDKSELELESTFNKSDHTNDTKQIVREGIGY